MRNLFTRLIYLLFAVILAVLAWAVVVEQSNPLEQVTIDNIPLRIQTTDEQLTLFNSPPDMMMIEVRTTAEVAQSLNPDSFQASVTLDGLTAGLHRAPIMLNATIDDLQILSMTPAEIDVELVPIVTRTVPIVIEATNNFQLSGVFEMHGTPMYEPQMGVVRGPEPLVVQVAELYGSVSVANARETLQRTVTVVPRSVGGDEIEGVMVENSQTGVTVTIRRRLDVREVNISAVTTGAPPDGYWMSSLSVEPTSVTLQGDPALLGAHPSFINTLPVDVSAAFGRLSVDIPLDVPEGMQAFDANGDRVEQVSVRVQVSARQGDVLLNRPITLLNASDSLTITLQTGSVELLLSGDLPTLRQIEADSELVQVTIDISNIARGVQTNIVPDIVLPEGVRFQLVSGTILIEVQE